MSDEANKRHLEIRAKLQDRIKELEYGIAMNGSYVVRMPGQLNTYMVQTCYDHHELDLLRTEGGVAAIRDMAGQRVIDQLNKYEILPPAESARGD